MMHSTPAGSARMLRAVTSFALSAILLGACGEEAARSVGPNPPTNASLAYLGSSASTGATITLSPDVDPNGCLTVLDAIREGSHTAVKPCDGSPNQAFTIRGDGTLRVTESLCLDAFNATGNDGEVVGIWTCHGGENQRWTPTDSRDLRTIRGKCLDVAHPASNLGPIGIIWTCHGGINQKWTARTLGSTPTQPPGTTTPPPSNPPPSIPVGDLVGALIGSLPSSSAVQALGGVFARYESDFATYDEPQWAACGPKWDCIDYYDRAAIYYARWKRTGNSKYLDRANQVAVNFRTRYVEDSNYGIAHNWAMMDGVALHYLLTGDPASLTAVGKVADSFAWLMTGGRDYIGYVADRERMDNRIQAYYLKTLLLAHLLKAPSVGVPEMSLPGRNDYAALLRSGLDAILATRDPDGQWRGARCGGAGRASHPFTVGLLYDALIRYYTLFEADPRIPQAIKGSGEVMWRDDWVPAGVRYPNPYNRSETLTSPGAFKYVGVDCPDEGPASPSSDLNQMIVNGYAFVGKVLGDATFSRRADEIFAGGVNGRGVTAGIKQFNQQYTGSMYYIRARAN